MCRYTTPKQSPTVSVVTVCYNAIGGLKKTTESIHSQTFSDWEHIVVDGHSSDGTQAWLQEQDGPTTTRWVSEPDNGIYDAMNKGVEMSRGTWVIFMNAGDTFADNDVLRRVFSEERVCDVIYGDVIKHGKVKKAEPFHNAHRMYFCHQSALVRRECLTAFPFDCKHRMSADFKQMKQLGLAGKRFLQVDFPIACFDTGGVSNTRRSEGLKDNIAVVRETDSPTEQLRLLPRLYFTWLMCLLRGR